jgi:2-polyprenyl-6-methoxyphenol hydroxylase-like FAD-dependent oxidoreductase
MNVIIVGGGIAGPALGVALAKADLAATILEARHDGAAGGAFLNLAPNGINALAAVGLGEVVERANGVPLTGIRFHNATGREIAFLDGRDELQRYGAQNHLVRRDLLHFQLEECARAAGVDIRRDAKVVSLEDRGDRVRVTLADGSTIDADVVVGADGIHSVVRRIAFPDAPLPSYTGVLNCGGWTDVDLPDTDDQHLVFGRRAFFGYVVRDGVAYWFSNVARRDDPTERGASAVDPSTYLQHIRALHADDPYPVPEILAAASDVAGVWPVYDIAELATWHRGRICLVGDAAHATSPNAGQGASLALEDAVVLAQCLRDLREPEAAFGTFEALRKARAERIVKLSRRLGKTKVPSRFGAWFRDRTLPFFLKVGAAETVDKYRYRVDFDRPVEPAASSTRGG